MTKKIIYFLCTGNSARSQIAEGLAKKYLSDDYEVHSAGIEVNPVSPYAIEVMKEIGIDITHQTSDLVDLKLFLSAEIVVTLCKDAYERCPAVPPRSKHVHWGYNDPAGVKGTTEEILEAFRAVRDDLENRIKDLAKEGIQGQQDFIDKEHPFYPKKENYGAILKAIREEQGLSQSEFSEALKVNEDFLKRAELNTIDPSKFFIHRVASFTNEEYNTILRKLYEVN